MDKLYFVLSCILLSIITVVNIESGWRFVGAELITAMAVMLPDIIGGIIKDVRWLYRDYKKQRSDK